MKNQHTSIEASRVGPLCRLPITTLLLAGLVTASFADLKTGFENEQGYVPGDPLTSQSPGDVRWHGKPELLTVVEGEGVDGSQALQLHPIGSFATIHTTPSLEAPPVRQRWAVSVRLDDLAGGSFQVPVRFRVGLDGEAEALRIHCYEGGKMEFFSNETIHRVKDADEEDFIVRSGVYTRIEAELDYTTGIYRLKVDGVPQQVSGSTDIPFMNTKDRASAGQFEITGSHPVEAGVFIDDLEWVDIS